MTFDTEAELAERSATFPPQISRPKSDHCERIAREVLEMKLKLIIVPILLLQG